MRPMNELIVPSTPRTLSLLFQRRLLAVVDQPPRPSRRRQLRNQRGKTFRLIDDARGQRGHLFCSMVSKDLDSALVSVLLDVESYDTNFCNQSGRWESGGACDFS